jgi:hypothetical protein
MATSGKLSLVTDGSTLLGGKGVIGYTAVGMHREPGEAPVVGLWNLGFPGAERQLGETVARDICKEIFKIGPERVTGVCADNCSTMKKALNEVHAK